MRSACERHNHFRGCQRKTPSLALKPPGATKASSPPARGLPASPGVALSNFGRGRHSGHGTPSRLPPRRPHPRSPLGFVPLQTHLPRAPKNTPPPPALPISLSKGTKERQERNSRRVVPRSAHSPARNVGLRDYSHPKGTTPLPPNAGLRATTHRCGAPEEAARREQASAGSQ